MNGGSKTTDFCLSLSLFNLISSFVVFLVSLERSYPKLIHVVLLHIYIVFCCVFFFFFLFSKVKKWEMWEMFLMPS
jgi:hypothetical protein